MTCTTSRFARFLGVALAAPLAGGCGATQDAEVPFNPEMADAAAATITAGELIAKVGVLAHDSMRGRATPSPELDAAADWIGQSFAALGLTAPFEGPDGAPSFEQRYSIRTVSADLAQTWATAAGGDTLRAPADLSIPFGPAAADLVRSGGVVAVDLDDFDVDSDDPGPLDGAHVIVVSDDLGDFRGREAFATIRRLGQSGAAAIWLLARNQQSEATWSRGADLQGMQARTVLGEGVDEAPVVGVRRGALAQLVGTGVAEAVAGVSGRTAMPIPDLRLTLRTGLSLVSEEVAPNVAGILPGSDPELASQFVVYSAHMDHVGVGAPDERGDSIYNGADDDASGTAAVMEIAEAFAALETAPPRSTIFLLVSGEERGLWGSQFFAENPPVPVSSMVANLNADMVGRNWSDTIVAIGKEHSELGPMLERVNERHPELGMTAIDDIWPEENFYGRSDHYNFARKGVPILFFFNGTHEDYHKRTDEVDKIDADKAARIATLMFRLGLDVSYRPEPPAWREASRRRIVEGAN